MRGTVAKRIRREVYGDHVTSSKGRNYLRDSNGTIVADTARRAYQWMKRKRRGAGE